MFLGKIEARAKTRELEVTSPSLNTVNSIAGSLQDVPEEFRDQSEDKRAEVTSPSLNTVTSTESNLYMCLRNIESTARTRELEVTSLE